MNRTLKIHRGDAEARRADELTSLTIGRRIENHRELGPRLLESAYEECLCHDLSLAGVSFERQKPLPVNYKKVKLDCGYRIDFLVEQAVIVELKAVEEVQPVHEAQLLTYLKLSKVAVGLLINFNVLVLKEGIKRMVNDLPENLRASAPPRFQ